MWTALTDETSPLKAKWGPPEPRPRIGNGAPRKMLDFPPPVYMDRPGTIRFGISVTDEFLGTFTGVGGYLDTRDVLGTLI